LKTWIPYWDAFLDALLWCEGQGDGLQVLGCPACNIPGESSVYCCNECFFDELICKGCCLHWHARLPFHHVKEWKGLHFKAVALANLGLCVQLNHASDEQDVCPSPKAGLSNFIVLHVNGLHSVNIIFCGCSKTCSVLNQLLQHGLFPTTVQQPQTCSTFQLLHYFHLQSIQLKVSTIHFYQA
ncbi:hypothetical protein BS47DRAFT_1309791, partial [Hydnum rufescens UP504]